MRTNIDIDDALMEQVMEAGGFRTKKAAVEESLRLLARTLAQGRLRALRGRLHWEGSLDDMRRDR
ncbi:MAG: type II toxin-antitoxin system VapB family antitoxin [Alphaproteobacteria bacterium]|nr:type II toxin-antitoxin system VapB family antitoxin [Alphaproteobacteria bacterium]